MRVSTKQQYDAYLTHIQSAYGRYSKAQEQVMTGKRWQLASEAPGDAQSLISVNLLKARTEQLDKNLTSADDYLKNTESTMTDVHALLNRAYTIAVNGANTSYDQNARDGMANEIMEMQKRLAYLGNATGGTGQYIFGGQLTGTKPFQQTPPTLTFSGDDNPIDVEIRPGETMRANLKGAGTMFSQMYDTLEKLKNDLMSGDVNSVGNTDIKAVQSQIDTVAAVRGDVGSKLQSVQNLRDQNQRRIDDLTTRASDLQDVDLSQALTEMQTAQTAYTAALQVAARGQSLSLMDFLR